MKRTFLLTVAASWLLVSTATAQVLDTVVVPTDSSSVTSTLVLAAGVPYELRASGTFTIGGPGDGLADAEYADFSNPPSSLLDFDVGASVDLGVTINGTKLAWGAYEPSHVYSVSFIGSGATIGASYQDSNHSDNTGTLTLEILQGIPEPTTTTLSLIAMSTLAVVRRRS